MYSSICSALFFLLIFGDVMHQGNRTKVTVRTLVCVACLLAAVVLISYRVYVVLHRTMPAGLAEADKIRWLDELGRVARVGSVLLHDMGVELGLEPLKIFINTAFSLLFNPLPWQRVVYRNVKVNQDIYNGVAVSTYTPTTHKSQSGCEGYPTIVYFHGGGWTWLSVGVYDGPLKHLASMTKFKIIAVEYRKSPQHPFPASYEDCLSVTKYIVQQARALNVCKDLIVVAGDGAGGNLAAAVANEMSSLIRLQVLINPALQMMNFATPSYQDFADNALLSGITSPDKEIDNWIRYGDIDPQLKSIMAQNLHVSLHHYDFLKQFLESRTRLHHLKNLTDKHTIHNSGHNESVTSYIDRLILDSSFNPMFTPDVMNTAEAYIITSQYDVLRDEALMYGDRLVQSGVKVEIRHYWQGFHGFFLFAGGGWVELKESQKAMDDLVHYLDRQVLGIPT